MRYNDWYDTAQVCLNGHAVNAQMKFAPEDSQKHCSQCGEPTISECLQCHLSIRGRQHLEGVVDFWKYDVPKFCSGCGAAYPWTARKLAAAKEMADFELGEEDAEVVKANLDDIQRDNFRTEVAAHKIKRVLDKASIVAGQGLYQLVVDIASETAAKVLKGP